MAYKEKCIVIYANPYSIDNGNGTRNEGVSFNYLPTESLTPAKDGNGRMGYSVMKDSVNHSNLQSFTKVPGIYEIDFETRRSHDGKAQLKAVGVKFLQDLAKF